LPDLFSVHSGFRYEECFIIYFRSTDSKVIGRHLLFWLPLTWPNQRKEKPVSWREGKIRKIIGWVERHTKAVLKEEIAPFEDSMNRRFRRDVASLEEYYTDLEQEMTKSLERPGLSGQLIQDRQKKSACYPMNWHEKPTTCLKNTAYEST